MPLCERASTVALTLASLSSGQHMNVFQPFQPMGGVAASMPSGLDALQSSSSVESASGESASIGVGASVAEASCRPASLGRSPSKIDESQASAHERKTMPIPLSRRSATPEAIDSDYRGFDWSARSACSRKRPFGKRFRYCAAKLCALPS